MTKVGKRSSRRLEVVITRRIVQDWAYCLFQFCEFKTYLWGFRNINNLLIMVEFLEWYICINTFDPCLW